MREFPRGGLIGRSVHFVRAVAELKIPLYAANACFFLVLAVFPGLLLLLGLLRYTPLQVERLAELLTPVLPEALLEGAEELILLTYDNTSGAALGVSAATALWSAGRGIHGILTGLNAVYGAQESRGWLRTRLLSVGYTFAFLLVLLLTLGLQVFGAGLLELLRRASRPFPRFLAEVLGFRFGLLVLLQTGLFAAMFTVLPDAPNRFRQSLPGALAASMGWLLFSKLYSVYVEHFAHLRNVYGSVYAVALSMLWLYCCMSIVFFGGAVNRYLLER